MKNTSKNLILTSLFVVILLTFSHQVYASTVTKTLYAWARDLAGNISAYLSDSVDITVNNNIYYLSPSGSDTAGDGSINNPWFSLNKAWQYISAGDTVYLRGGTYHFTESQYLTGKNGTDGNTIKIFNYPGENPVLTYGATTLNELIYLSGGNYLYFKGLEIIGAPQRNGEYGYPGLRAYSVNNTTFELIKYHDSSAPMDIIGDADDNLVLNCDFYNNADPYTAYGNADGLDIHFIPYGNTNTIRGSRAWNNSDDGFDLYENDGLVIIDSCWSWHNGYIPETETPAGDGCGFKLGRTTESHSDVILRVVANSVSSHNRNFGFTENNTLSPIAYYNNIAYHNNDVGFVVNPNGWGHDLATILKNNISYNNYDDAWIDGVNAIVDHNTFLSNGNSNSTYNVADNDFSSLVYSSMASSRQSDGSLPNISFLHLVQGSDLIDTGTNVGLPYYGDAPDLGAFETNY